MTDKTAVLLDRHPLWVDALRQLLERVGVEMVAVAGTVEDAVRAVEAHRPALLVVSLDALPARAEAWECMRLVRGVSAETRVVVVSGDDDPRTIEAAFAEGAAAFCAKSAEPEDLAAAVRQSFVRSIHLAGVRASVAVAPGAKGPGEERGDLTRRELEILQLVAEGHSNSQLAKMLWVTEQTVKFHLSNIYRKLEVANRTEAGRWAQRHGLLSDQLTQTAGTSAPTAA